MTTPEQIVRCLKSDIGNLPAAIDYAEKISAGFRLNPWAEPGDAENYAEAARRLRAELAAARLRDEVTCTKCGGTFDNVVIIRSERLCYDCFQDAGGIIEIS